MSTSSVRVTTETLTSTNSAPATAHCMSRPRSVVVRRPQPPFRTGVRSAGQLRTRGRWNRCMWPGSRFRSGDAGFVDTCVQGRSLRWSVQSARLARSVSSVSCSLKILLLPKAVFSREGTGRLSVSLRTGWLATHARYNHLTKQIRSGIVSKSGFEGAYRHSYMWRQDNDREQDLHQLMTGASLIGQAADKSLPQ